MTGPKERAFHKVSRKFLGCGGLFAYDLTLVGVSCEWDYIVASINWLAGHLQMMRWGDFDAIFLLLPDF